MDYDQLEDNNSDNRKERRWNIPIPVVVRGLRADGTEFKEETITADASPTGMCLLLTLGLKKGEQLNIAAPEEKFESPATVCNVSALGPNMNRIRVAFPKTTTFKRALADKKYVYDYYWGNWVGYIQEGVYYNTKYEPFGKVEGNKIVSLDSGAVLFTIREGCVYGARGEKIGDLI